MARSQSMLVRWWGRHCIPARGQRPALSACPLEVSARDLLGDTRRFVLVSSQPLELLENFVPERVCVTDLRIPHYHTDLFCSSLSPTARHGDGLYDSYMRTDHILKDEADTNSPSGLPPMPKHTVSIHTNTHIHAKPVKPCCQGM